MSSILLGGSLHCSLGLPQWLSGEESTCIAGDVGLIPGLERSSGGGNGYPLQYSCLKNPIDRGPWQARVCGVTKSWTRLSMHTQTLMKKEAHV